MDWIKVVMVDGIKVVVVQMSEVVRVKMCLKGRHDKTCR